MTFRTGDVQGAKECSFAISYRRTDMRQPDDAFAKSLIDAHHAAWSRGDIAQMLAHCHEDVELVLNTGGPEGGPLRLIGKEELRAFLEAAVAAITSRTIPTHFSFAAGVARTTIHAFVRHRKTGHTLHGTYRQVILFDGDKVISFHEYHDAALMQAFWAMVQSEEAEAAVAKRDEDA